MLKDDEKLSIQLAFENYSYICGSPILPEEHPLYNTLYIKINQTCYDHIEQIYYSCKVLHSPICYYCGEEDELVEADERSKSEWHTIYPLCSSCQNKGLRWFTKGKMQVKKRKT
jgi:hypothetical protein